MAPHISICIPTYNRAALLNNTLAAMIAQSVNNWEIIVGDDASVDETEAVVRNYNDPRIKYFRHQHNVGIYANWNALIEMAKGDYICIYHDHDMYLPTILQRSEALLDSHPDVSFVHTASLLINKNGLPVDVLIKPDSEVTAGRDFQIQSACSIAYSIVAASAMVRREAYESVGPYNAEYGLCADKEMWLRLAGTGNVGYINEPQAFFLIRDKDDMTAQFNWQDSVGLMRICSEWIARLYDSGTFKCKNAEEKLAQQWNNHLLRMIIKTAVYEDVGTLIDREKVIAANCSGLTRVAIEAIRKYSLVRYLLRCTALPRYENTIEARVLAAESYCRQHPEIARYLPKMNDLNCNECTGDKTLGHDINAGNRCV